MTEPMTREEAYEALEAQLQALSAYRGGAKLGPVSDADVRKAFDHGMRALAVLSAPVPVGEVEDAGKFVERVSQVAVWFHPDEVRKRDAAITAAAERALLERMLAVEMRERRWPGADRAGILLEVFSELRSKLTQKEPR